jgi:hypothetical protein
MDRRFVSFCQQWNRTFRRYLRMKRSEMEKECDIEYCDLVQLLRDEWTMQKTKKHNQGDLERIRNEMVSMVRMIILEEYPKCADFMNDIEKVHEYANFYSPIVPDETKAKDVMMTDEKQTWHISTNADDVTRILSYMMAAAVEEPDSFYDFVGTIVNAWNMRCLWVESPVQHGYCVGESVGHWRHEQNTRHGCINMVKVELFEIFRPHRKQGQGAQAYRCLERIWKSQGIEIVKLVAVPTAQPFWTKMGFTDRMTISAQQNRQQRQARRLTSSIIRERMSNRKQFDLARRILSLVPDWLTNRQNRDWWIKVL